MVFNPYLIDYYLYNYKTIHMKYNELTAFLLGLFFCIIGAILFGWSDYTPDGALGRKLEAIAYVVFILGVTSLVSMFVFGNKPKQ